MLNEIHVQNVALIEDAHLELASGLTVLTGETGAGKTALLSALKLLAGQRADSKMVRDGAREAFVEARFADDDDERIASRKLTSAGRSRCTLDGAMATVAQLADALSFIHIHSQHEQVSLLQPASQLEFLDRFIDSTGAHLDAYRCALADYRRASKKLKSLEEASLTQSQELDYQRFVMSQISAVDPKPGEYEQLEAELPRLKNAQSLTDALRLALGCLAAEGAAADELSQAARELERLSGVDGQLDELTGRIDELSVQLDDVVRDLRAYAASVPCDPAALQSHLERLSALSGLMRRYGPEMGNVLDAWAHAREVVEGASSSPADVEKAKRERNNALARLQEAGAALQALREKKALELCGLLGESVEELAMPGASFEFVFEDPARSRWTDAGPAAAELFYRPSPGATARPLRQIASGGELSRILLALECVLRANGVASPDDTLVFDEVDSGIGGATGEAVGRRLKELAAHAQVVVVTHLAQVAVHADNHFVVQKRSDGVLAKTTVEPLDDEQRVFEIARMLSGSDDETALEHARTLLGQARAL